MTIVISALAEAQIETLRSLAAEVWREHYPPIIGAAQTEYMLAQRYAAAVIRSELARDDVWWDVLCEDEEMLAFASSFAASGELKLDKLYVRPAQQRKGYGGALLAHTCGRARGLGLSTVILAVNRHNSKAIAAYRKHGFDIRETAVTEIGEGFVMDDYIMQKSVG